MTESVCGFLPECSLCVFFHKVIVIILCITADDSQIKCIAT